ncbi:MAG: DUF7343 domain-containing protein [Candidatus Nezhaarchaeales archaeon]
MAEEAIMRFLMEKGRRGALQSEISETTGFSKSTISYFLSKLESEGKIVRKREPNVGYRVWLKGFESDSKLLKIGIVRAAEYPFIFELKSRLENEGFGIYVKVYDDGVALMSDLVVGKINAGFSPLVTQLMFYAASRGRFKIIASGVSGGGSIILRRDVELNDVRIAGSTMASTMDACLKAYLKDKGLSDVEVIYFDNPKSMVEALDKGVVQMLSIWEPYSSLLEMKGHKRIARFTDYLGDFPCCVLAVNPMDEGSFNSIVEALKDVLSRRNYTSEISKLSSLLGVDLRLLRKSLKEYVFHSEFTIKEVKDYLKSVGLEMTSSWALRSLRVS